MCVAIALIRSEVPTEMIGRFRLGARQHDRDGRPEFRFAYDDPTPRLPIRRDGQFSLARWGNRRGQSRHLPRTGWTWHSSIDQGHWAGTGAVAVEVPASFGYDGGVWFKVRRGLRGLLVPDERGMAVCYLICEPPSHYYKIMTRAERMPLFIGERF